MLDYKKIAFGFSSAETEKTQDPDLLLNGYIDFRSASDLALNERNYLVLGYKGAGKSMIGERLELLLSNNYSDFVRLISLADFPFKPFSKIVRGEAEPQVKYPTAWSWILLVYLLESFGRDEGVQHHDKAAFLDAVNAFRLMGLSPSSEPAKIVRTSSKPNFKLSLPGSLAQHSWSGSEIKPASDIPDFVESIKELISGINSESRHYIIIDGLDDILTSKDIQYESLSALVFEVQRLNSLFFKNSVPAKIIILCRTDLFERIPGANKNKVRQDYSVELDWYHDPSEPDKSLLVQIAQLRARRSLGKPVDIFSNFMPAEIDQVPIAKSLLDMTRHTPRDFLRLLSHLQEFSEGGRLTIKQVKSGMREYSIKYFLPEIQDELSGYATSNEISLMLSAFEKLRKREFKMPELLALLEAMSKPLSKERTYDILQALFECSAIGNVQARQGGNTHFTFKYRNRHSNFMEHERITLHRGLWKALNVT